MQRIRWSRCPVRRSHHIVGHLANNVTEAVTARNLLLWNVETQVCVENKTRASQQVSDYGTLVSCHKTFLMMMLTTIGTM